MLPEVPEAVLHGLVALLAMAEERSATRAARRLVTTPATVLRRLDALEEALGVRLFDRLPTGLLPTPALERILPWAEQAVGAVVGMQRETSGLEEAPRGTVRVAVPTAVASSFLVPALPDFRARHPDIVIEFASEVAVVDLPHRDADLALRTLRPTQGALVARKLAPFRFVLACAPSLLGGARRTKRRKVNLSALPWIQWDTRTMDVAEARWLAEHVPDAQVVMRASDMPTIMRAAQLGLGAIVVAEPLAAQFDGLVSIPTKLALPEGATWLVAHQALRHVPRVDAVWNWIVDDVFQPTRRTLPPA